jgi:hypothetical protein
LEKRMPKLLSELTDQKDIARITKFMHISPPQHSVILQANGRGVPYYYCLVLLDTTNDSISNVFIKELK